MNNGDFTVESLLPVMKEVLQSGGEFRLYPRGTSMMPLLRQGRDSVALVAAHAPFSRGDILLYRRQNGQYVLHRLIDVEGDGSLVFCGDNQSAMEKGITPDAVLARVNALWRDDQRIELSSRRYRTYMLFATKAPLRATRLWRRLY